MNLGERQNAPPPSTEAWAQAQRVLVRGNGLPGRWQRSQRFVILETGFGLGNPFLATWAAWRADPDRCDRLVFISIEKHPVLRPDLARAHGLGNPAAADIAPDHPALAQRLVPYAYVYPFGELLAGVLMIIVTLIVLAVQVWGLAALVVTAVAFVPVMFCLLIWITLP